MVAHKRGMRLMGSFFVITVVAGSVNEADEHIDAAVAEISRIESLLTTFRDTSQVNDINRQAGIAPVQVDREVFDLVTRSVRISELTQGAFDITYGSVDTRFWNFDTTMTALPDRETAKAAVRLINYRNVVLDGTNSTIFLKHTGMRIGFGGIGKGYAAEQAKRLLINRGIQAGVVNASGDLAAWGYQPDGSSWTIGIADPDNRWLPFSSIAITGMAVATSGNYEKFVEIAGKRYSHTIDPKTGFPVSGIKSVTIICSNAELADALTTPVTIMGVEAGLDMINQMRDIACIIIDDDGRIFTSNNIKLAVDA